MKEKELVFLDLENCDLVNIENFLKFVSKKKDLYLPQKYSVREI